MNSYYKYKNKKPKSAFKYYLMVAGGLILLLGVLSVMYFNSYFKAIYLEGRSMLPTIQDGTYVYLNNSPVALERIKHGDLITFNVTLKGSDYVDYYLKRVIALPGDELVIDGPKVYVNGELLIEDYLNESDWDSGYFHLVVPEDHVFVMGDNRNYSTDSRDERCGLVRLSTQFEGTFVTKIPSWMIRAQK